jgi:predicted metal-dependent HD superfamily phosphohydrolase
VGRHSHSAAHVADCLGHVAALHDVAERPAEIEVAIWFHDAVYDTHRADNEERSAAWARRILAGAGADAAVSERIERLILATKTHEPHDRDAELFIDIDLSILGAPPDMFACYDADIRREYHWVPVDTYRAGRARILQQFLDRPVIFRTLHFHHHLEPQARTNLKRAIRALHAS